MLQKHYLLCEEVGKGVSGRVYKARDTTVQADAQHQTVAVKAFFSSVEPAEVVNEAAILAQLRSVALLLKACTDQHSQESHIVTLLTGFREQGQLFLVFEFLDQTPFKVCFGPPLC